MPSEKYSFFGSPLMFANGRTAIEFFGESEVADADATGVCRTGELRESDNERSAATTVRIKALAAKMVYPAFDGFLRAWMTRMCGVANHAPIRVTGKPSRAKMMMARIAWELPLKLGTTMDAACTTTQAETA